MTTNLFIPQYKITNLCDEALARDSAKYDYTAGSVHNAVLHACVASQQATVEALIKAVDEVSEEAAAKLRLMFNIT